MRNHVAVHHYSPGADLGGGGARFAGNISSQPCMQSWLTGCFKSARGGEFTPRERAKSTSQAFRLQELVGYHHYFREDLTHQGNGTGRSRVMCLRSHDSLRTELAWQDSGGGGLWAPDPPRPPGSGCPIRPLLKTAPLSFCQC